VPDYTHLTSHKTASSHPALFFIIHCCINCAVSFYNFLNVWYIFFSVSAGLFELRTEQCCQLRVEREVRGKFCWYRSLLFKSLPTGASSPLIFNLWGGGVTRKLLTGYVKSKYIYICIYIYIYKSSSDKGWIMRARFRVSHRRPGCKEIRLRGQNLSNNYYNFQSYNFSLLKHPCSFINLYHIPI
jgi:hypothetical protein